jgi:Leucine-rich repeat (LRR) protein
MLFIDIFPCHAFNVKCDFTETSAYSYNKIKSGKVCKVRNLVIKSPSQEITSINRIFGSSAIRNDVTVFRAYGQTMNYLPRDIEKFFPNIEAMLVQSCKLKEIKKQNLEAFPQLKNLYLASNDIEKLDDDLFVSNEKLLKIDLENNKIKFIGEETFKPLKNLNTLWLHNNQCISKEAVNDVNKFKELINEVKSLCRDETKSELRNEITTLKAKVVALENENHQTTNQQMF